MSNPLPVEITLHNKSRILEIAFDDGARFELPCEYLRVNSPSAEVLGHHNKTPTLQVGKEDVNIVDIQQVGTYAIKIFFDDKHKAASTLGTTSMLWASITRYWADYLQQLAAAGHQHKQPKNLEAKDLRNKLSAFLFSKGFEYDLLKEVTYKLIKNNLEEY